MRSLWKLPVRVVSSFEITVAKKFQNTRQTRSAPVAMVSQSVCASFFPASVVAGSAHFCRREVPRLWVPAHGAARQMHSSEANCCGRCVQSRGKAAHPGCFWWSGELSWKKPWLGQAKTDKNKHQKVFVNSCDNFGITVKLSGTPPLHGVLGSRLHGSSYQRNPPCGSHIPFREFLDNLAWLESSGFMRDVSLP